MADQYMENNTGSKKKFLIPLVVLLLCAVSLTGAGYAYSSSVSNTGDVSDDAVILAINGNSTTDYAIDIELDWISTTTNGVTVWELKKDAVTEFTMGYEKTDDADFDGKVKVTVSKLAFAYTIKIGNNDAVTIAKSTGSSDTEQSFEVKLDEGLTDNNCKITVAKNAVAFDSNNSVPNNGGFKISATTELAVPE